MNFEPGQRLAHYRIDRKIGEGGMGIVYLAEDTRLGRKVALKVLPGEMASDASRRARFEREARAIAALNHPNIVTIHSVEEENGVAFLTMELVEGQPLHHLFGRDGVPLARLLDLSLGIAEALVAAHRQGVVHRDLKPDNIMFTADGRVKVLDFGLAKLRDRSEDSSDTALPTRSITEEGRIIGTVSYMSPEQAEGRPLDHRSDIFSFGIVLYEMATGQRPFKGATSISTISSILKDTPPPLHQVNAALPADLGRIVRRCLMKEPERRYQSTDDLRNELRELKEDSASGERTIDHPAAPGSARGASAGHRPSAALLATAALIVVTLAGAAWLWSHRSAAPGAAAADAASPGAIQMRRATSDGAVQEAAISPDGRYLAYTRREKDDWSLRLRQVVTGDEVQVVAASPTVLSSPSFSSDGNFLHYVSSERGAPTGAAQRVSVLGGSPRRIADGVYSVSASRDGRRLAMVGGLGEEMFLRLTGPDGEDPRELAKRTGRDHFDTPGVWSPDGRTLAIVSHRIGEPQQIILIDSDSGQERVLPVTKLKSMGDLTWIPGKEALLVAGSETPANQGASTQLWEVSLTGEARTVTHDLNDYSQITMTSDGATTAVVQVTLRTGIEIAPLRAGAVGEFTELFPISEAGPGRGGLAFIDSGRLVHSMLTGETEQLFVTDLASKASRALTTGDAHRNVRISRDGRVLVASRNEGAHKTIWRVDVETGREQRLTSGPFDEPQAVSKDGSWVVYASVGGEILSLNKIPGSGGAAVTLVPQRTYCSAVSPDDREALCLQFDAADKPQVVTIPLAGGAPRLIAGFPEDTRWVIFGPDGRSFLYLLSRQGSAEIWSMPVDGDKARRLARLEGRRVGLLQIAPDGSRLAVVSQARSGDVVLLTRTGR